MTVGTGRPARCSACERACPYRTGPEPRSGARQDVLQGDTALSWLGGDDPGTQRDRCVFQPGADILDHAVVGVRFEGGVVGQLFYALFGFDSEDQETFEPMTAEAIAEQSAPAVAALNKALNARAPIDEIKGGAYAHGNLESLLNIAAGLVMCFTAVAPVFKQVISWIFILGTLLHSGRRYLRVFNVAWAGILLGTGVGPILILLGLLLAGIAVVMGFRGEPVKDS